MLIYYCYSQFRWARFSGCNYLTIYDCLKIIKQITFMYTQMRFCKLLAWILTEHYKLKNQLNFKDAWILGNFLVRFQGQKLRNGVFIRGMLHCGVWVVVLLRLYTPNQCWVWIKLNLNWVYKWVSSFIAIVLFRTAINDGRFILRVCTQIAYTGHHKCTEALHTQHMMISNHYFSLRAHPSDSRSPPCGVQLKLWHSNLNAPKTDSRAYWSESIYFTYGFVIRLRDN